MVKNCLSGLFSIQFCWRRLTPIVDRFQLNQQLMHMKKKHIEKRLNQRGLVSDVVSSSYSLVPKLSLIQRLLHRTDRTPTWPSDPRSLRDETEAYLCRATPNRWINYAVPSIQHSTQSSMKTAPPSDAKAVHSGNEAMGYGANLDFPEGDCPTRSYQYLLGWGRELISPD